jgi:N-acetylmuramic acid 6-phosphate etherase
MPEHPHGDPLLSQLATEAINPATSEIDRMAPIDIVRLMNEEDASVAGAVKQQLPEIAQAVEAIAGQLRIGGRLVYIGAGTSGRIGALDAYECPPTFNVSPDMIIGCIAGGASTSAMPAALATDSPRDTTSVVAPIDTPDTIDYEDSADAGANDVAKLAVGRDDVVVGIAASGRTPYVLGAMRYAREQGALTVGLACNRGTPLDQAADIMIAPVVGPEVIAGSTRLKAGTAQKMVLNMLSTGAMILLGKTYGNMMVDMRASNEKLRERAIRIVQMATGLQREQAASALEACDSETKTAILVERSHLTPAQARECLAAHGDRLRAALEAAGPEAMGSK